MKNINNKFYFIVLSIAVLISSGIYFIFSDDSPQIALTINELAYNQSSGIDWIEIYNPSSKNMSLKGYFLSDDLYDLTAFEIEKDLIIESGGFLVIYCDGYEGSETNTTITNFRIANGETVYLTSIDGSTKVDSLEISQDDDISNQTVGNYPDGSQNIYTMPEFTRGMPNSISETPITSDILYEEIFDDTQINDIYLTISDESLEVMSNFSASNSRGSFDSETPDYASATLTFDGETYSNIAIRYKGNSTLSQSSDKLPYRIDMNKYEDGQTLSGIQEFVLNPNFKDESQIREIISYSTMRDVGFPAEYASFAKVYVNDEYTGLYTMVENVDEDFLERTFGNSDGLLIKSSDSGSGLEYIDNDIDSYDDSFYIKQGDENEAQDFIDFLDLISSEIDDDFEEDILKELDVYGALDYFAMLVTQTSMDSYLYSGRNFYIYFDTDKSQYSFIPWDMNESFGVYAGQEANLVWSISEPTVSNDPRNNTSEKPIFESLMEVDTFRSYYLNKVEEYSTDIITLESLASDIESYTALVYEAEGSADSTSLKEFISERNIEISNQLSNLDY